MKFPRRSLVTGIVLVLAVVGTGLLAWALAGMTSSNKKAPAKADLPAVVAKTAKEDEFNTIQLTPRAEERLGIRTAAVERRAVPRVRLLGGEVVVPAGHTVVVAAPLSGALKPPAGGVPPAGRVVKRGQPVFL